MENEWNGIIGFGFEFEFEFDSLFFFLFFFFYLCKESFVFFSAARAGEKLGLIKYLTHTSNERNKTKQNKTKFKNIYIEREIYAHKI